MRIREELRPEQDRNVQLQQRLVTQMEVRATCWLVAPSVTPAHATPLHRSQLASYSCNIWRDRTALTYDMLFLFLLQRARAA